MAASQNFAQPVVPDFTTKVASGISTSSDRYKTVNPIARPKPGNTLGFFQWSEMAFIVNVSGTLRVPWSATAHGVCRIPLGPLRLRSRADLVEHAAIGEMNLLRLRPRAERLLDGEQRQPREPLEGSFGTPLGSLGR